MFLKNDNSSCSFAAIFEMEVSWPRNGEVEMASQLHLVIGKKLIMSNV